MNQDARTPFKALDELLVLHALQERDMYGYELEKKINNYFNGEFSFPSASLYALLYRLEKKRDISPKRKVVGKRMRVYYHLELPGRNHLKILKKDYNQSVQLLQNIVNT